MVHPELTEEQKKIAEHFESLTEEENAALDQAAKNEGRVFSGNDGLNAAFDALEDHRKRMVSMRLPPAVIEGLKAKAERVGIPYQTLAASVLKRYVEGKLDIEAA